MRKGSGMKQHVAWLVAACALCAVQCSNNNEVECRTVSAALTPAASSVVWSEVKSDGTLDIASVRSASDAAAQASRKLRDAKVKDKTLAAQTFSVVSTLGRVQRELDATLQTIASDEQAVGLKKGYASLLKDAEAELEAVCTKKERHRKTARKKRLECRVVRTMLDGLAVETLPIEGLQNAAEGLSNLPVKIKSLRQSVDKVAEDLLKIRDVRVVRKDLEKKLLGHRAKLATLFDELTKNTAKVTAFCKRGS